MPSIDISKSSFDEFVGFLFAREIPPESVAAFPARGETKKRQPWYWNTEVTFDSRQICRYYSRMFLDPGFLLEKFSKEQLEEGFWAIQSVNLECSVFCLIWDPKLPLDIREELIRSMFYLFRDLFSSEPLETSVYMWWDSFCYEWHCGNRERERGGEDTTMQDVLFETLSRILSLSSEICQGAALHGLSHLHHPKTGALIERFLQQNASLTEELRAVAIAAAKFELL